MRVHESTYDRVRQLVPPATRKLSVMVIGAGMVGSWTAAALARMVGSVTIVDFDAVENVNVGVQMYTPHDVGLTKVDAVLQHLAGLPILAMQDDFELMADKDFEVDVLVSALDSMSGRTTLFRQFVRLGLSKLWVDVRVMGELVCVLTSTQDVQSQVKYTATLLAEDAVEEAPCGAEGTVYSGMFSGARVAAVINNWARGIPVAPKEVWHTGLMQHLDPAESPIAVVQEASSA